MSLASLTRSDVLAAVAEFDRLGRDEFLERHGFGTARTYFLELNGSRYDSKAIAGYAHGVRTGDYLRSGDFTGGDATVVRRLQALGFVVRTHRNPPWTRDEVVLACDLVRDNDWRWLDSEDERVGELSELLQFNPAHPLETRGSDFRNRNGVARKTADIATQHPEYTGKPTKGGQHDRVVIEAFVSRPAAMAAEAKAIRMAMLAEANDAVSLVDLDLDGLSADEGAVLERRHLRRERDPRLRRKVIEAYKRQHGKIACEACGFDFQRTYGIRGADFIEVHHRTPLHVSGPVKTRADDLVLLCSNCHRMIHRTSPWLTVDDLMALVTTNVVR
ncbi:HNH endonuclease [Paractinoplanes atraurantiacus]|uniref:5-methylcytosine-specific restriction enzyme A n=1 Tax=Paractinoplanes atraurantiacus TaxID=1036182 RepID=A0A285JD24_9ACTN|nr:HNH endonuclease [Actinoplanes atraurantiacus]SNY58168.1 5-methylcytosine-specific restriction enzyme A [Actinoplanes atraurantiacus]